VGFWVIPTPIALKEWANYTQKVIEYPIVFPVILRYSYIGSPISLWFLLSGEFNGLDEKIMIAIGLKFSLMFYSFSDDILIVERRDAYVFTS
jgi:hypothetical protein